MSTSEFYFREIFPVSSLAKLLTIVSPLKQHEIAYQSNFFSRYNKWTSPESAANSIEFEASRRNLQVVHIGPAYTDGPRRPPVDADTLPLGSFSVPDRRALIFDIDLTDYFHFDIQKTDVDACDAAWPIVGFAISTLKSILRSAFGFQYFATFFSGRRGAHLWVLDDRACSLNDEGRKAVFNTISLPFKDASSLLDHPVTSSYVEKAINFFETQVCKPRLHGGMGFLDDRKGVVAFATELKTQKRESQYFFDLVERILSFPPEARAEQFKSHVRESSERTKTQELKVWVGKKYVCAVLNTIWPKADENVTTHVNHLIKAPFSLHGSTGRVAVYVPEEDLFTFDPASCPSLPLEKSHWNEESISDFKTSVQESAAELELFLDDIPPPADALPPPSFDPSTEAMEIEDLVPPPKKAKIAPRVSISSPYFAALFRNICVQVSLHELTVCVFWQSRPGNGSAPRETIQGHTFPSTTGRPTTEVVDAILSKEEEIRRRPVGSIVPIQRDNVVFSLLSKDDTRFIELTKTPKTVMVLSTCNKETERVRLRSRLLLKIGRERESCVQNQYS